MATAKKRRRTALFSEPEWEDLLAIRTMRLGNELVVRMTAFIAEFGITPLQYNVLRILYVRDEEGEGLPVGTVGEALVVRGPDVSRLLDRLEGGGLVERVRKPDDRRVVRVRLTRKGFDLVEKVHAPLIAHHRRLLGHVSKADLERLCADLARVLEGLPPV